MSKPLKISAWSRSGAILYPSDTDSDSDSSDENEEPLPSLPPPALPVVPRPKTPAPASVPDQKRIATPPPTLQVDLSTRNLDLSRREDGSVVKNNPFTQAKRRAVERIRRESLPPSEPLKPKRRGTLAIADPDPDRPRPADSSQEEASTRPAEPYRRKFHDGWFTSTNQPIPNYRPAAKAKQRTTAPKKKSRGQDDEQHGPPKKKPKTATGKKTAGQGGSGRAKKGKAKKSKDQETIQFGRVRTSTLPNLNLALMPLTIAAGAAPNSGFPIVQGFEKQRSLPVKSVQKPAPFPMILLSDSSSQESQITPLDVALEGISGIASAARKEFEEQQAKINSLEKCRSNATDNADFQAGNEAAQTIYDDPPTLTYISRHPKETNEAPLTSSSAMPYSSPLGRRNNSAASTIHNPVLLKAFDNHTAAAKLEELVDETGSSRTFQSAKNRRMLT